MQSNASQPPMNSRSRQWPLLASLLGGVALAGRELWNLHRGIQAAHAIAAAVAKGLGDPATVAEPATTVSVSLCFGLVPLGSVANPYPVVAAGNFLVGALIARVAIVAGAALRRALRRRAVE
jgi:hypothetical protein